MSCGVVETWAERVIGCDGAPDARRAGSSRRERSASTHRTAFGPSKPTDGSVDSRVGGGVAMPAMSPTLAGRRPPAS